MECNPNFKDQKGGLVFFGLVKVLFGVVIILFFIMTLFTLVLSRSMDSNLTQQLSFSVIIAETFMYFILGASLIILGIGSIKKTRWARALTLIFSWMTFVLGIFISIVFYLAGNYIFSKVAALAQLDSNAVQIVRGFVLLFFIFILVIVPGVFILFYRRNSVIRTVEKYDHKERWTDKCPLPLLALCFILCFTGLFPLFTTSTGLAAPFFCAVIKGLPAAVLLIANAVICIYLAVQIYKKKNRSWYYSLYLYLFWMVSVFMPSFFGYSSGMYCSTDLSDGKNIVNICAPPGQGMLTMGVLLWTLLILFIFYTKRFLRYNDNF